jgi:predicted nucleic acid-binding protein
MELFTPVYVFEELDEHRDEVKSKSRINDKIFELFIYHPLASKI